MEAEDLAKVERFLNAVATAAAIYGAKWRGENDGTIVEAAEISFKITKETLDIAEGVVLHGTAEVARVYLEGDDYQWELI